MKEQTGCTATMGKVFHNNMSDRINVAESVDMDIGPSGVGDSTALASAVAVLDAQAKGESEGVRKIQRPGGDDDGDGDDRRIAEPKQQNPSTTRSAGQFANPIHSVRERSAMGMGVASKLPPSGGPSEPQAEPNSYTSHHQHHQPLHKTSCTSNDLNQNHVSDWLPPHHIWNKNLFNHHGESFLEELARQEASYYTQASYISRRQNQNENMSLTVTELLNARSRNHDLDNNDDEVENERHYRFMMLDFSSDNGGQDTSDSEDDISTSTSTSTEDEDDGLQDEVDDNNPGEVMGDHHEIIDANNINEEEVLGDSILLDHGNAAQPPQQPENILANNHQPPNGDINYQSQNSNGSNPLQQETKQQSNSIPPPAQQIPIQISASIHQFLSSSSPVLAPASKPFTYSGATTTNISNTSYFHSSSKNPNHHRISNLLSSLANSEEQPLIRADIPWNVIISCGSPFMPPHTPNQPQHTTDDIANMLLPPPFFSESTMGVPPPPHLQPKPTLLRTLYQQNYKQLRDPNGARLLQGMLRMDPPYEAVKVLIEAFPLSCLDMEGFFTACQFAHPNTSRRTNRRYMQSYGGGTYKTAGEGDHDTFSENEYYDDDDETDDVGEVVKLVMRQTIQARRLNSIDWGMVAFLGDARITPSQAKLLLRHAPEALIDPKHGAFGVSPMDRMASGFFIHGETNAWVDKLRLALRVAAYVKQRQNELEPLDDEEGKEGSASPTPTRILLPRGFFRSDCKLFRRRESSDVYIPDGEAFYPYHELIRLLVSGEFRGNKFGQHGFLQTLKACTQSDPDAFLRTDNEGNLPLHIALKIECNTVLGVKGERRLVKYLLDLDRNMALCPDGGRVISGSGRKETRQLPLRLSIEHAWPVYDIIIKSALARNDNEGGRVLLSDGDCKQDSEGTYFKDYIAANMISNRPLLHDALNGNYHARFGIHGARQLAKNMISIITQHHYKHQQGGKPSDERGHPQNLLTNFADFEGRTVLHVALESKWPVYDLIVQANPNSIEDRDPTQYGFYPFQIAACAFKTTSCPDDENKVESCEEDKTAKMNKTESRTNTSNDCKVASSVDKEKEDAFEMSMLFELIRESPLCVTWKTSDSGKTDSRERAEIQGLSQPSECQNQPSKKRQRP